MQLADALQSSREMERTSWMMSSLNATSKIQHLLSTKQFDAAMSHLEESTWQGHQLISSFDFLPREETGTRESNDQVQQRTPSSSITAGADMSPGVRDRRRMDDANEDE